MMGNRQLITIIVILIATVGEVSSQSSAVTPGSTAVPTTAASATTTTSAPTTTTSAPTTTTSAPTTTTSAPTTTTSAPATTTSAPTTTTSAPATTTSAPTTAASAPTTTSAPTTPTTAPVTMTPVVTAAPPADAETTTDLTFTSRGETFTSDLSNSSSAAFMARATSITNNLVPFYQREFASFRRLSVLSFRNGSIINMLQLTFTSSSVPNNTQIAKVLAMASRNVTAFNIDTTSIVVNGMDTPVSTAAPNTTAGGVSHKISLGTASVLVLLSWLLSCQQ